jgi:hypothetical protein
MLLFMVAMVPDRVWLVERQTGEMARSGSNIFIQPHAKMRSP